MDYDTDSDYFTNNDFIPCEFCKTPYCFRRVVRLPKEGETYNDSECDYCGAIVRIFSKLFANFEVYEQDMSLLKMNILKIKYRENDDGTICVKFRRTERI